MDENQSAVAAPPKPAPVDSQFSSEPSPHGPTPPPPTPEPVQQQQPKPKSSKMWLWLLIFILIAGAVGFAAYSYGKSKAPTKVETKTVSIAPLSLPEDATVISQCSAGKGSLYALPKDIPTGPVYMVNKGKVIGIEYMVGKDDLLTTGKSLLNLPLSNKQYDHVNIGLLSQGHAGFPTPHYHVDIYTIPDVEAKAITCPKT